MTMLTAGREVPMESVRVMVVDDSMVARRLVRDSLRPCTGIEVVATAGNGRSALAQIPECGPDVVVLDIEMPVMDGMMTLRQIHERWPQLPVVMMSGTDRRAAEATAAGALAYVRKPSALRDRSHALTVTRDRLEPVLRGAGRPGRPVSRVPVAAGPLPAQPAAPPSGTQPAPDLRPPRVVLVGASTGGPTALGQVLPALPGDLGVPVLVVQHMPPVFTRTLARRLDARCALSVTEAEDGMPVLPNHVYLAPGGRHLVARQEAGRVVLRLDDGEPVQSCRPAVDVLLRSAAQVWGSRTLTVVLTGMGHDGLDGARELRTLGGRVIAQDRESSVVWGMPGAVARAGLAGEILPLAQVADAVVRLCRPSGGLPSEGKGPC
jgi:two-component system chemotaxis response regulator CheB